MLRTVSKILEFSINVQNLFLLEASVCVAQRTDPRKNTTYFEEVQDGIRTRFLGCQNFCTG